MFGFQGKTKHFQTIVLDDDLILCDCPGLVFPTLSGSRAEQVVSGILRIDEMRDPVAPVTLICERIPREVLEMQYSINLPIGALCLALKYLAARSLLGWYFLQELMTSPMHHRLHMLSWVRTYSHRCMLQLILRIHF